MLEDVDVFAGHYVVHERAERPDPAPRHASSTTGHLAPRRVSRADLRASGRRQRRVRPCRPIASATSPSSRRPPCTTTTWPGASCVLLKQTRGARRLRSDALPVGAHPRDRRRRRPRARSRSSRRRDAPRDGSSPLFLTGYGAYGIAVPGHLLVQPAEPARSRRDRGHRPRPRRRRAGQALARRRPHAEQAQHLHRLHRRRRAPGGARLHRARSPGDRGRQRGRPPHGRGAQHAPRPRSAPRCSACRSWTSSTPCSTSRCRSRWASSRSGATRRSASTTTT